MIFYETLRTECLGRCCLTCINRRFQLKLKGSDCMYLTFPYNCAICGEVGDIVSEVAPVKRFKLLVGKDSSRRG